jgi:fluoroquinolone resistance protein
MDQEQHEDKTFDTIDYSEKRLPRATFIDCRFVNCNFSRATISGSDFMGCKFTGCNFSLAAMENTGLKDNSFKDCKMVGIDFSKCSDFMFSVHFENCPLDYCSFFRKKMKKTIFLHCSLKEADFTETDLSMAAFSNCDLMNTSFVQSNLEKADFRTARNYSFDPDINKMKRARFSKDGVIGLLAKYNLDIVQ